MGTFRYGSPEQSCTIDDRALAHLQIVIISKLRYGERFAFSCRDEGSGASTMFWLSPSIPMWFDVFEPAPIMINPRWLHALERTAGTVQGLHVVDEPEMHPEVPTRDPVRELAESHV